MKILLQKDINLSMKRYKDWYEDSFFTPVWLEDDTDFSNVEWEEYNKRGNKGIKKSILYRYLDKVNEYHKNTIDMSMALVQASNWKEEDVIGWHLGAAYAGCRITLVKNRRDWLDTAKHETMHALWTYIRIHTGTDLKDVLGTDEDGFVHGDAEGFEEYKYEEHLPKIKPHLQLAVGEDKADEYRSLLQLAIRKLRKIVKQLRLDIMS